MATIEVQGVSYPVPESFTYKELSKIKEIAGVRAGEFAEAMAAGDVDVIVALAVIVMERAGLKPDVDKLYEMDADQISAEDDQPEQEEELPPAAAAAEVAPSGEDQTVREIRPVTREASGGQP